MTAVVQPSANCTVKNTPQIARCGFVAINSLDFTLRCTVRDTAPEHTVKQGSSLCEHRQASRELAMDKARRRKNEPICYVHQTPRQANSWNSIRALSTRAHAPYLGKPAVVLNLGSLDFFTTD